MKFSAIIILFYPERPILLNNIRLLENNGWQVVVVDNSPQSHKSWLSSSVEFRHCPENAGIAHAQNIGLLLARQQGRDYAMLLDQDSHLTEHLLQTAKQRVIEAQSRYPDLAAYGPTIVSEFDGQVVRAKVQRAVPDEHGFLHSRQIIASGKIIPLAVLSDVGLMEDALFIDGVDHEWCWRASRKGFRIISDTQVLLRHKQGESRKRVLGMTFKVGSPVRLYYQYRNILILLRRSYVPLYWKVRNCVALPVRWVINGWCLEQSKERRRYMRQGLTDGLRKRAGRYRADQ
ncbi:glycosyltransferase family 2 protein [Alteromonas alba]|uniref:Glycosyltransferase family 2 protein n=1 Tax=Alteromonas alba TaxID=2079529 RepID=A0A2S9VBN8_9ALTE|nr:glycosyltransferase family 2 protein [Alteromonas alba]MCP4866351.1 glycosyltransferase family 2 protein [Alteromonas sp.]PRO73878.1 glycosyltransferase family 2 protein [Alteromonas alba]